MHTAVVGGSTTVVRSSTLDEPGARVDDARRPPPHVAGRTPLVAPNVQIFAAGDRGIATAVLLPHDHDGSPLPVLLDPYGGPHALRVQRASNAFASAQWFADQGFAVVVARRSRHAGARSGVGACRPPRPRHGHRSTTRSTRSTPPPTTRGRVRPRSGGDPWLELRRVPGRARRAAPARRVPRRDRRRTRHRVAALRHLLHRALPRPSRRRAQRLRARVRSCRSPPT